MQYHTRYTITYPRKPTVGTVRFWQSRYWWLQPECSPSKVLLKTHNFFILFSKNKILPHKHHNFLSLCTAHTLISFLLSKNTTIVIFFSTNKRTSFKILSYYTISKGKENHRRSEKNNTAAFSRDILATDEQRGLWKIERQKEPI